MRSTSLALLVFLAHAASATPCTLALNSKLKLLPPYGLVEAEINGQPVHLMMDTGSFTTVLTEAAGKRLDLRADSGARDGFRGITRDPWAMRGIGGSRFGEEMLADTFKLGALTGRRFHILTADIGLKAADGLLSTDFITDYDVDLDFAGGEIRLFRAYGDCNRPKVFLQPPLHTATLLESEDHRPRVDAYIGDHHVIALIDTGAYHSAIYRHAAAAIGVAPDEIAAGKTVEVHGIGPNAVSAAEHIFPAVTVGDLTLRNMHLQILDDRSGDDIDLILGRDFQRKLHLWISNASRQLIMQYPPQPSPALE